MADPAVTRVHHKGESGSHINTVEYPDIQLES